MVSHGGFIAYYRVSTSKQGKSGLGIEAQRPSRGQLPERRQLAHARRDQLLPIAA